MTRHLLLFSFLCTLLACQKEPGFGGNATITGRLQIDNYNEDFTTLQQSYYPIDQEVFILFGENSAYGDKERTDTKGYFQFSNLTPGQYTIYAYSKDSSQSSPSGYVPIQKTITIDNNQDIVDIGTIRILDNDDDGFATIRGRVYGLEGTSGYYVPDERVYLAKPNQFGIITSQRTKYDGTYEFTDLPIGTYDVYVYTQDNQVSSGIRALIETITISTINQETTLPDFVIDL